MAMTSIPRLARRCGLISRDAWENRNRWETVTQKRPNADVGIRQLGWSRLLETYGLDTKLRLST